MITKAASARPSTSSSNCRRRSGSSWPNCASSKKRSSRASSSGRRTAMPAKLERSSNPFLVPKNSRGPVALPCPNRPFSLTEPKVSQRYQLSSANQSINQPINQPISCPSSKHCTGTMRTAFHSFNFSFGPYLKQILARCE